eukprot:1156706-Pelagomonas_calceolata.AAC.6
MAGVVAIVGVIQAQWMAMPCAARACMDAGVRRARILCGRGQMCCLGVNRLQNLCLGSTCVKPNSRGIGQEITAQQKRD